MCITKRRKPFLFLHLILSKMATHKKKNVTSFFQQERWRLLKHQQLYLSVKIQTQKQNKGSKKIHHKDMCLCVVCFVFPYCQKCLNFVVFISFSSTECFFLQCMYKFIVPDLHMLTLYSKCTYVKWLFLLLNV